MKKNKIFIFIILLFSFVVFFANCSFADTEETLSNTYSFTGFDNKEYSLPSLPNEILNCDNFVIVTFDSSDYIYVVGFDFDVNVSWDSGCLCVSSTSDIDYLKEYYIRSQEETEWTCSPIVNPTSFKGAYVSTVIDCSDDLLVYQSKFKAKEDFFLTPLPLVLVPVVRRISLTGVLQEIVEILPVVLVIIVGLIGLRKALKMLSTVLHRS